MAIFLEYLQKFMAIFVDDFTVYSSKKDHIKCLKMMLKKCREKGVCPPPYKSLFGASKGMLLGHAVSERGIEMAEDKVKAILEAVAPTNANEVVSFLGYVKFYRRFVEKLAEWAAPIYALTKKEVQYRWIEDCQKGFEEIKNIKAQKPILRQPNWQEIFHVHVDASNMALGAILEQPKGDVDFSIYFASRRFSNAEVACTTTKRKALGMVYAVQKFMHYFLEIFFIFYVDHQALLHLINKVIIQGCTLRWMLLLQGFHSKVIHKPGKRHFSADFLSRATPRDKQEPIKDDWPSAELFTIIESEQADLACYMQIGEMPEE